MTVRRIERWVSEMGWWGPGLDWQGFFLGGEGRGGMEKGECRGWGGMMALRWRDGQGIGIGIGGQGWR